MKKSTIHIICGIFEVVFAIILALALYVLISKSLTYYELGQYFLTESIIQNVIDILLSASLFAGVIVVHRLAIKYCSKGSKRERERKQRRIERLQSKIDELNEDGE